MQFRLEFSDKCPSFVLSLLNLSFFFPTATSSVDIDPGATTAPSLSLCWWGEVGGPQAVLQRGLGDSFAARHPQRHPGVCPQ